MKLQFKLTAFCLLIGLGGALLGQDIDVKQEIVAQQQKVQAAPQADRSRQLKVLALLFLNDQDQEHAFETFIKSLAAVVPLSGVAVVDEHAEAYKQALAIYLNSQETPQSCAKKIIEQFSGQVKDGEVRTPLGYLVAIAYANLRMYADFFNLFYDTYKYYPEHFLAFRTKAILHVKLMERVRTEEERRQQRQEVLHDLEEALVREPHDTTLYKLLITFSFQETKDKQVQQYLNKILNANIIIPRGEVMFYVQEAVNVHEFALAQRFIDKAREWYKESRLIVAAQQYLDAHKK